jgi:MFS family permease
MAILQATARIVTGQEGAEFWMRALYPGLWIMPAFLASATLAQNFSGHRYANLAVFLFIACNPITLHQFMAGRIDHHGAQIALSTAVLACIAISIKKPKLGFAAGALTALCLAIGLEALPHLLVSAAALAIFYAWTGQGSIALRNFSIALVIAAVSMWIVTLPPSRMLSTACDALAGNLSFGLIAGGGVLATALLLQKQQASFLKRLAIILFAGFAAALTYVLLDPTCIHGPFAATSTELKLRWLNEVNEMKPVLPLSKPGQILENIKYFAFLIPAIVAAFFLMRLPQYRQSFPFWTLIAGLAVSVIIGLSALRMTHYIIWLAAPILTAAVFEFARSGHGWRKATALGVGISPAITVILPAIMLQPFMATDPAKAEKAACLENVRFESLKTLPKGLVMAEPNLGPFILANTEHSVVAAPYHRVGRNILAAQDFFSGKDYAKAQMYLSENNIAYVVICRTSVLPNGISPGGLYQAILNRGAPAWLSPVSVATSNPLEVYKVNR